MSTTALAKLDGLYDDECMWYPKGYTILMIFFWGFQNWRTHEREENNEGGMQLKCMIHDSQRHPDNMFLPSVLPYTTALLYSWKKPFFPCIKTQKKNNQLQQFIKMGGGLWSW